MAHPSTAQLGQHLEELSRRLHPDSEPAPLLDRVVAAAVAAVPGARHGGLTVVTGAGRPRTRGATGDVAARVDRLQYELRDGPCLDTAARDDPVRSDDLRSETRWSGFGPACADRLRVRSLLCVRLRLAGTRAAMSFYAEEPAAFGAEAEAVATLFAPFAAMALQGEIDSDRAAHLATALESSRRIGTAIGIIMARELLTEEQAFQRLVQASQHLNVKLRDVAERVRETGTVP